MKTMRAYGLAALLAALGAAASLASCRGASEATTDPTPIDAKSAAAAAAAANRFGFDLYARLLQGDEDLILSPFSAAAALAMASAGARGQTLAEMTRVLHVDDLANGHAAWGDLVVSIGAEDADEADRDGGAPRAGAGAELHVANRIWMQQGWSYRDEFLSILRNRYRASLGLVDFDAVQDAARLAINEWVQEKTKGRIANLLPEGSIDGYTRLVLTNAVYFKGAWQLRFPVDATHDEAFIAPRGRRKVPMMKQLDEFAYAHVDDLQVVELLYAGDRMSMVIVLPDDPAGLEAAEHRIGRSYDRWMAVAETQRVDLWLPKWRLVQDRSLSNALKALGMPRAFEVAADFSGMSGEGVAISDVFQKAFIEVNERGAEAAAATGVVVAVPVSAIAGPPPPPPRVVHADHPFLYLIRDRATGVVLFLGRVDGSSS